MQQTRLTLTVDGVETPAVLTVPDAPQAALLLVPGSLNPDVDGNFEPMFPGAPGVRPHAYKDLAEQLTANGITVLRFSKRGPGTGCITHDPERAAVYATFPQRLVVAAAFFGELARRTPGLPLIAAGHSEGSVVATQLARQRSDMRGLVLLSGPSLPLLRHMIWQLYRWDPTPDNALYVQADAWARAYAAGDELASIDVSHNRYAGMIPFFLQPNAEPYLRSLEQVDPTAELAQVTQPVLIVQGGRDRSVIAASATRLRAAQPRAEIAHFPELQHFYKIVPEGTPPEAAFGLESESDPAVAQAIARWAQKLVTASEAVLRAHD